MNLDTILLVAALVCFILAAFSVLSTRVHFGWLGLAAWVLTLLV